MKNPKILKKERHVFITISVVLLAFIQICIICSQVFVLFSRLTITGNHQYLKDSNVIEFDPSMSE